LRYRWPLSVVRHDVEEYVLRIEYSTRYDIGGGALSCSLKFEKQRHFVEVQSSESGDFDVNESKQDTICIRAYSTRQMYQYQYSSILRCLIL
jgi:hypothetical protein